MTDSSDQWRMEVATALGRIEATQIASSEARRTTDNKLDTLIAEQRQAQSSMISAQQNIVSLQLLTVQHTKRLDDNDAQIRLLQGAPWRFARRAAIIVGGGVVAVVSFASEAASHYIALWISGGVKH